MEKKRFRNSDYKESDMTTYLDQILRSLGVIIVLLEVASVNSDSKICKTSNGKFPKAGTFCKGYYECKNWVPVEKSCGQGNNFIPNRGCNWHSLYRCPETVPEQEQFKCPRKWGDHPNIHRCSMYWWCLGGEPLIQKCPPSQLFDKIKWKCVAKREAVCADETDVVERGYNCPFNVGLYSSPKDCSKYYDCLVYVPMIRTCQRDRLFDNNKRKCAPKELVHCGSRFNPYGLSTTEKVKSTVIFTSSTSSDDQNKKTTILETFPPPTSTKSTAYITYSTLDPDFERTNSKDLGTSSSVSIESTSPETQSRYPFTSKSTPSTSSIPSTTNTDLQETTISPISSIPTEETEHPTSETVTNYISSTKRITVNDTTLKEKVTTISIPSTTNRDLQETTISPISYIPTEKTEHPTSETVTDYISSTKRITVNDTTLKEKVTVTPEIVEVTTSIEQNIICPKPFGLFAHPSDKHKFISCDNNVPSIFECPSNLVYNEKRKRCDYKL